MNRCKRVAKLHNIREEIVRQEAVNNLNPDQTTLEQYQAFRERVDLQVSGLILGRPSQVIRKVATSMGV